MAVYWAISKVARWVYHSVEQLGVKTVVSLVEMLVAQTVERLVTWRAACSVYMLVEQLGVRMAVNLVETSVVHLGGQMAVNLANQMAVCLVGMSVVMLGVWTVESLVCKLAGHWDVKSVVNWVISKVVH